MSSRANRFSFSIAMVLMASSCLVSCKKDKDKDKDHKDTVATIVTKSFPGDYKPGSFCKDKHLYTLTLPKNKKVAVAWISDSGLFYIDPEGDDQIINCGINDPSRPDLCYPVIYLDLPDSVSATCPSGGPWSIKTCVAGQTVVVLDLPDFLDKSPMGPGPKLGTVGNVLIPLDEMGKPVASISYIGPQPPPAPTRGASYMFQATPSSTSTTAPIIITITLK